MEQNQMAVREQQWLETIQSAKKSGLPIYFLPCSQNVVNPTHNKKRDKCFTHSTALFLVHRRGLEPRTH